MKKLLVAVALVAFSFSGAYAQNNGKQRMHERQRLSPERRAALQTETMNQKLELTPQQKQRLHEINLESARDMQPVIEQRNSQNERIRRMEERRMTEYRKVLTPEQMGEYNEMRSEPGQLRRR